MGDVWAELLRLGRLVASCKPDFRAVNLRRSRPQPFVGCDVCAEEPKTPDAYDVSGVFCVGSRAFVRRLLASS